MHANLLAGSEEMSVVVHTGMGQTEMKKRVPSCEFTHFYLKSGLGGFLQQHVPVSRHKLPIVAGRS